MDEFFLGLLGCSILFALVAVPVAFAISVLRRFTRLEKELADLRGQLGKAYEQGAASAAAPVDGAVSAEPVSAGAATPPFAAETRVTTPTPAFFETQAAPPPEGHEDAGERPFSAETVVSTPLPALFETRVSAPEGADGALAAQAEAAQATGAAKPESPEPSPAFAPPASSPTPAPRARKSSRSLEETLWTRLPVWLGAVALALAAAYLVKLSFERGWIGPGLRVVLGVLFGAGLLGVGDFLRKSSDYVAKGLSAAGISALFVSFFAATSIYHLVPPVLGFGLMALTTATAVVLSLRQGYIVAIVGLLGGFLTPALVGDTSTSSSLLFLYLLLLEAGLLVVARRRSWPSLPFLTLVGGLLWVLARLGAGPNAADSAWIGLFLVFTTGLFLLAVQGAWRLAGPEKVAASPNAFAAVLRWLAVGGALLAMMGLLADRDFGTLEWIFLGLIAAGAFVLARLDEDYHGMAWLASGVVTFLLFAFTAHLGEGYERAGEFVVTQLVFGLLIAVGAFLAHFGSRFAGRWASLSAATAILYLLMQYSNAEHLGTEGIAWGAIALLLGGLYVAAALPAAKRRRSDSNAERPLAAFAVGATTLLSLAVPLELDRQWLTVAWALEVWALLFLAGRLKVTALRYFAALMAALVAIRLLLNPEVISYPIGTTPIFNWLLYGYGIPLAAFVAAAVLARRQQAPIWLSEMLEWLAQALAFALVSLEIRHFFYRDASNLGLLAPGATDTHLVEWGTYASFWLLLVFLQQGLADKFPSRPLLWGSRVAFVFFTGLSLLLTALLLNPLWSAEYVGQTPIFNWLLWIYGLPAVLRILLARRFEQRGDVWLARLGSLAALLEIFLLITFEVRQAFQGSRLDSGAPTTAESYAYSFAWIALAFVMAVIGVRQGLQGLRYGSAIIMLVAVFKVFLFDTANLEGIFRVLSLFGLGVALFVLAYLYRRFVFPPQAAEEELEA